MSTAKGQTAKVIAIYPRGQRLIAAIADRLLVLIEESGHPNREMDEILTRLLREDLWSGTLPSDLNPRSFVQCVIEDNEILREIIPTIAINFTPAVIETVGDLLSYIPRNEWRFE